MMQGPLTRISPSSAMRTCTLAMGFPELPTRSEEHTSELQSQSNLVCRLLLEKKNSCAAHIMHPLVLAQDLCSRPAYVDATQYGGTSRQVYVRHAVCAIAALRAETRVPRQ